MPEKTPDSLTQTVPARQFPGTSPQSPAVTPPPAGSTDSTVGRFVVLNLHARGGLGEVFAGTDTELNRAVALKRLREQHADSSDARRRFVAEAEVTARLDHPGVVPVYGLVQDADGRPCYAMRFVRGQTLKEAIESYHRGPDPAAASSGEKKWGGGEIQTRADSDLSSGSRQGAESGPDTPRSPGSKQLAFRQLLQRFTAVCQAVAYAHSRGVLHRDIKPANILLGPFGETLVVDWGLAKHLDRGTAADDTAELLAGPSDPADETRIGLTLGTPAYMAPEQAAGRWDVVGPAADVYSLGATLYHILTGKPAFAWTGDDSLFYRIQGGEFPRPRQANATAPPPLGAVCLKAMARNPENRYPSALALAADVERYLADEPVSCYQAPLSARLARAVRRHPAAVAGAITLAVTLAVASAVGFGLVSREQAATKHEWERAEREKAAAQTAEARASAVNRFLIDDVLAAARPKGEGLGVKVTLKEALDAAAEKIGSAFAGQPDAEATVRYTLGQSYKELGEYAAADAQIQAAHDFRRQALGPDHPDTLRSPREHADVLRFRSKFAESETEYRAALDACRRVHGDVSVPVATSLRGVARALRFQGKYADSEPLLRQAVDVLRQLPDAKEDNRVATDDELANLLHDQGKVAEAEPIYRQVLADRTRLDGPEHPTALRAMNNLASALEDLGRYDEAGPLYRDGLEVRRRVFGPDHPSTLTAENNLAVFLVRRRQDVEAEAIFRRLVVVRANSLGEDSKETIEVMQSLGAVLIRRRNFAEAEDYLRRAIAAFTRTLGPDHPMVLVARHNLGSCLHRQGKLAEAEAELKAVLAGWRKRTPAGHPHTAVTLANLGNVLIEAGKAAEAEPLLRESLAIRQAKFPPGDPEAASVQVTLARCLTALGRFPEAEALLLPAHKILSKDGGRHDPVDLRDAILGLAKLYEAWDKPADAAIWQAKLPRELAPAPRKN